MQVFLITLLWTLLACYVEPQLHGEENAPPVPNAQTQRRLALVIGNGAYTAMPDSLQPLANPVNDAEDIAKELSKFGFEFTLLKNGTLEAMDEAIHSFSSKINKGDVALLYYSGHGIQVGGENFLLPVDAKFKREEQVERQAIKASLLLHKLDNASTKLVFLDACRNNPFLVSSTRGIGRNGPSPNGLAKLSAPDGTLLVYSTDPDNVAEDGNGRNSPFTQGLLKFIGSPGKDVQRMLREVRKEVKRNTDNRQTPWDTSSLVDDFYFVPGQENQQLPVEKTRLAVIKNQQQQVVMPEWNQDEASKLVLSTLQKEFLSSSDLNAATFQHTILNHYYLKYDKNDERFITVAYSKPPNFECHTCAPKFSFVEFKKLDEAGWILGRKHLKALDAGSGGEPPESVKIYAIGNDTWGFFIKDGYTSTGQTTEGTSIYVDLAGKYHEVFHAITHEDNGGTIGEGEPGYYSLDSDISINTVPGASFFDLVVTTKDTRKSQHTLEKEVFKFDGQRYSSQSANSPISETVQPIPAVEGKAASNVTEDSPDFVDEGESEPEIQQPSVQIGDSYTSTNLTSVLPTQPQNWINSFTKYKQTISIPAPNGYLLKSTPSLGSNDITIKHMDNPLLAVGHIAFDGQRFYMTEWSWSQYLKGKTPNWVLLPSESSNQDIPNTAELAAAQPLSKPDIQPPSVQIGDSYIYQSTDELDSTSLSMTKRTVIATRNRIVLSSLVLNKKKAKPRKQYYDSEWCLINTRNYDNGGKDYTPPLKYFSFPLFPGKTWQQVSTETDIKTGKTRTHTITGTVGEREEVTVPAGTFKAIKVSLDTKLFDPSTGETMNGTDTSWYVPEIRRSVQSIMTDKDGKKVIQLMSYELNSHPVPPITQPLTARTSVQSFLADSSHMWLVVSSKPTIEEAQALARQYQAQYPKTTIFLSENNWYAISIGLLKFPKQEYLKDQWIKQGQIPPDSYFTQGQRFIQQLDF